MLALIEPLVSRIAVRFECWVEVSRIWGPCCKNGTLGAFFCVDVVLGIFVSIFWVHTNLGVLRLYEHHDVFGIAVGLYIR